MSHGPNPSRRRSTTGTRRRVPRVLELEARRLLAASPATSPTAIVTNAFETILFREPTAGDLAYWTKQVGGNGASLQNQLLHSPERANLVKQLGVDIDGSAQSFVNSLYTSLMGIRPDPSAAAPFIRMVNNGADREGIVQSFLTSPLYPGVPTTVPFFAVPSSTPSGDAVLLQAGVVPSAGSLDAGGSVAFYSGGVLLGSAPVSGFHAYLSTTALPAGTDAVTAYYSGDGHYHAAFSKDFTVVVTPSATVPTTTVVTPSSTIYGVGQTVELTAAVSAPPGGNPTGTVEFYDTISSTTGNIIIRKPIGTGAVSDGVATLDVASGDLSVGANQIDAVYQGDSTYLTSSSAPVTITILAPTTTALTASPTATVVGAPITLTATVAPTSGSGTPTGTVSFYAALPGIQPAEAQTINPNELTLGTADLNDGVATLSTTAIPIGTYLVYAQYSGDTFHYALSTSAGQQVTVSGLPTTTAAAVTSATPPTTSGPDVTFTATISGQGGTTPTGPVDFYFTPPGVAPSTGSVPANAALLGTADLTHGVATLVAMPGSILLAGTDTVYAVYRGDATHVGSVSPPVAVTVAKGTPQVTLNGQTSSQLVGLQIQLDASVINTTGTLPPTGTVTYYEGSTVLGTRDLWNGSAYILGPALPLGVHTITAVYSGDVDFLGATSAPETVTIVPFESSMTLTPSTTTAAPGTPVTVTAKVTPNSPGATATPTGSVTFSTGTTTLGTVPLDNTGQAVLTTSDLPPGANSIFAFYPGDTNYQNTGNATTVTIATMA